MTQTHIITIIGLGAGDFDQLSIGVYRKLKQTKYMYVRTKEHPVLQELKEEGLSFTSFDDVYESFDQFEQVYETIASMLIEKAKEEDVVYAVPGHPLVAERTVQLLLQRGENEGITVKIEGGQSFLDPLFSSLQIDPIEGFQLVDATFFKRSELQLGHHLIFCQVYDSFIASNVKLTLMESLRDDYEVFIVTGAGTSFESVRAVPLYMLDHETELNNLTSVYVPPVRDKSLLYQEFAELRQIIATLRGPNGCPWDKEQTHESLKRYLIEETYELLEAIDEKDDEHIIEELGDVLLQVMLHAQIGEDEGWYSIDDVIRGISEKMIRRHPHVFGDVTVANSDEVLVNWNDIKKTEKGKERESILSGIPKSLPQLLQAYELQKKAAKVGFDWKDVEPMLEKMTEEWNEFRAEVKAMDSEKMLKEFGDILFVIVNIARYYKINPEEALHTTNIKFINRFTYMEERVNRVNKKMEELSLEELDALWEEAKKKGYE
ncbi:nucleoside triphosphate pyrophosphohydrolase [Ectobacillus polymachus]|uniref:nucleoside triphosphate pyrophosphohydrolase n=1 Tax=Ectobacillus polymachus TaxID=1508806 RepID=UPI003A85A746